MNNPYGKYSGADVTDPALGFWSRFHPGVRSAIIVGLILTAIAVLNSFTGGTSIIFLYPVQILVYIANGVLAAYLAIRSGYQRADLPKVGAIAGAVGWVLPALFYLIFGLILGIATFGVGFLAVAVWVLCGPIDLAIHAFCGMLGGWLYGRFSGVPAAIP